MLTGVTASLLFTAIIQSSGATIGMVFAMLTAGALTSFEQAYPIIIGANVGTCATALIGAARSTVEAKRCALTHLLFNLFATSLAMATAPVMYHVIPLTTPGIGAGGATPQMLVSQCANANVIKMVLGAMLVLPFSAMVATTVRKLLPDSKKDHLATLLDQDLIAFPENALQAAILELQRMIQLCTGRLQAMPRLLLKRDTATNLKLQETESAVIAIQESMQHFLRQLSQQELTRRQSILATLLHNGIDHIERIADHIGVLARASFERHRIHDAEMPVSTLRELILVNKQAVSVMLALDQVLIPQAKDRSTAIASTLQYRDAFSRGVEKAKENIATDLAQGICSPATAIFRMRYLTELSRMVKHARALVVHTNTPQFRIKPKKLQRASRKACHASG
jgi:phosphate:Na+ symporter